MSLLSSVRKKAYFSDCQPESACRPKDRLAEHHLGFPKKIFAILDVWDHHVVLTVSFLNSCRTLHPLLLMNWSDLIWSLFNDMRRIFADFDWSHCAFFSFLFHSISFLKRVSIACYTKRCTRYRKSVRLSVPRGMGRIGKSNDRCVQQQRAMNKQIAVRSLSMIT